MHRRALIVLTLVLPAVLAGQSPPTPELPNAVTLQFIRFADIFGSRLVAAFDSIPAARACEHVARVRDRFGRALQSDLELHATTRHGASFGAAAEDARGDRVAGSGAVTIRRRLRARVGPGARRHAAERGAPDQVEHRRRPGATLAREQQRLLRQGRGRTSHLCARCEWSGFGPRPPPVWPRPAGEETSIVRFPRPSTRGNAVRRQQQSSLL